MSSKNKNFLKEFFKVNSKYTHTIKCIEELQELSLILTQSLTRSNKEKQICEEIAHVKIRLKLLEKYYDKDLINHEYNKKITNLERKFIP